MLKTLEFIKDELNYLEPERQEDRNFTFLDFKSQNLGRRKRRRCKVMRPRKLAPLDYWESYLKQRRKLSRRIIRQTGKKRCQVLLNCSGATEKAMLQRLFDQADQLSPENRWRKERLRNFRTKCNLELSVPDEKLLIEKFSVYGLPEVTKSELQCTSLPNWFKSKFIEQRLEEKKLDIFNLLKHFPDVDSLQVVGTCIPIYVPYIISDNVYSTEEVSPTRLETVYSVNNLNPGPDHFSRDEMQRNFYQNKNFDSDYINYRNGGMIGVVRRSPNMSMLGSLQNLNRRKSK